MIDDTQTGLTSIENISSMNDLDKSIESATQKLRLRKEELTPWVSQLKKRRIEFRDLKKAIASETKNLSFVSEQTTVNEMDQRRKKIEERRLEIEEIENKVKTIHAMLKISSPERYRL